MAFSGGWLKQVTHVQVRREPGAAKGGSGENWDHPIFQPDVDPARWDFYNWLVSKKCCVRLLPSMKILCEAVRQKNSHEIRRWQMPEICFGHRPTLTQNTHLQIFVAYRNTLDLRPFRNGFLNLVFELMACMKCDDSSRFDWNGLPSSWIATRSRRLGANLEVSKSGYLHILAICQTL